MPYLKVHRFLTLLLMVGAFLLSFSCLTVNASEEAVAKVPEPEDTSTKEEETDEKDQLPAAQRKRTSHDRLGKGHWLMNVTFSLSQKNGENEQTLLRDIAEQDKFDISIDAPVGYFIKDYFATGLELGYTHHKAQESFLFGDEASNTELRRFSHFMSVGPFIRNYLSLFKDLGIFYIFNQTSLIFSYGEGITQTLQNDVMNKTVSEYYALELGVRPGLAAVLPFGLAIEVSLDVLGLKSEIEKVRRNYVDQSTVTRSDVSLHIDLLSLNLGMGWYF